MTLLQISQCLSLFLQMTPPCFIQISVLSTCTVCLLKISARCTIGLSFGMLLSTPKKLRLWPYLSTRMITPFIIYNTHLSETDTHKHLGLLFHHSLSWHTHIIHLHQKVMTKINRLRSFVNLVLRQALLTIFKTNILPVFDYGNIIYDSCSDYDNPMLDKAQLTLRCKNNTRLS